MAWLVKTEPGEYSFDDLVKDGRAVWDGLTNPLALKNLRAMVAGESVFVYHTGSERRIVGRAEVVRAAAPGSGRDAVVELKAVGRLGEPVPLAALKANRAFVGSPLLRQGRLSVVPLSADQVRLIRSAAAFSRRCWAETGRRRQSEAAFGPAELPEHSPA
jgi:predicted RNA-binding protein with PUA-like domain